MKTKKKVEKEESVKCEKVCVAPKKITRLEGIAGNEDFNKVVEKINELVDKSNDSSI